MLTDAKLRALKKADKPYKLADARGLYVYVSRAGGVLFRFNYTHQGKHKTLSLGAYPDVSLKAARETVQEARSAVKLGKDPSSEKRRLKNDSRENDRQFGAVAAQWFATKKAGFAPSYAAKVETMLGTLGKSLPGDFADLTHADFAAAIQAIASRGNVSTAREMAQLAGRVGRFALKRGLSTTNAAAYLAEDLQSKPTKHRAAVQDKDLGKLLLAMEERGGSVGMSYALKILPHVFLRTSELRGARWEEIDLDAAVWKVPGTRMKMSTPHTVPLSKQVVALFRDLREMVPGAWCFPTPFRKKGGPAPISSTGMIRALRNGLGYAPDEHTLHGFRTVFSTWANGAGFPPDVIERQLAHEPRNAVRAAYNRADYLPERKKIMQAFSDFLDEVKKKAKV